MSKPGIVFTSIILAVQLAANIGHAMNSDPEHIRRENRKNQRREAFLNDQAERHEEAKGRRKAKKEERKPQAKLEIEKAAKAARTELKAKKAQARLPEHEIRSQSENPQ